MSKILNLASAAEIGTAPVLPLLEAAGLSVCDLGDPPEAVLEAAVQKAPLLMLCEGAVPALLQAMEAGRPPSDALARWQQKTGAALALYRRNRARMMLVTEWHLRARPDDALARIGAVLGRGVELSLPSCPAPPVQSPLLWAIATATLAGDGAALALDETLAASALPLPEGVARHEGVDAAFAVLRAGMTARDDLRAELRQERQVRGQQNDKISALTAQLEKAEQRVRRAQDERALLQRQIDILRDELTTQFQTAAGQQGALKAALHRAAEKAARNEAALRAELAAREADVAQLLASTSWRLSAPLRWFKRRIMGGGDA